MPFFAGPGQAALQGQDHVPYDDIDPQVLEHNALLHFYAKMQRRCTGQMQAQMREIERLQALVVRLRGQLIAGESTLAWERENRLTLASALAVRALRPMLAVSGQPPHAGPALRPSPGGEAPPAADAMPAADDPQLLENSLRAADLVICQSGCISAGAYWRVEDHCKRTGKACVLVAQPDALRIVRVHRAGPDGQVVATPACIGDLP